MASGDENVLSYVVVSEAISVFGGPVGVVLLCFWTRSKSASLLPGTCINELEQPKTMSRREGECLTHDGINIDYCPMQVERGGGGRYI